ncbi:hypothetical protein [Hydrogenophaga sp.]|uniref:hypothetical protein n=1 Tax=Hydrogenophaga sp. TaxID=1904254 RepID=UPI002627D92F|nr:hypothetical protein [Hydrogenophaga sp.]MCW5655254.1 hypothetical protein [Hydrogenophaga sp.]
MAKLTGGMVTASLQSEPGVASHTVLTPAVAAPWPVPDVCIELDARTQVPDVLPALQRALLTHGMASRVYDSPVTGAHCQVWLRYSTQMQWGRRWPADEQRPYLSHAALTLQRAQGEVLATSQYDITDTVRSKWATTYDKLAATVAALVGGMPPRTTTALL